MNNLAVMLACLLFPLDTGTPTESERNTLVAIRNASQASRSAINYGVVKFKYTLGSVPNSDSISTDQWTQRSIADGFYAFDALNGRHDLIFSPNKKLDNRNDTALSIAQSKRVLTDGNKSFVDKITFNAQNQMNHSIDILPGVRPYSLQVVFDFGHQSDSPGTSRLESDIDQILANSPKLHLVLLDENANFQEHKVVRLVVGNDKAEREYLVDLEHASFPRRMRDRLLKGGPETLILNDDFRLVGDRSWIPFTSLVIVASSIAKECKVLEADFSKRPDPSVFRLEFDKALSVIDVAERSMYSARKAWSLRELPRVGTKDVKKLAIPAPIDPPVLPGVSSGHWSTSNTARVGLVLAASVLLLSGYVLIRRRFKR